MLQGIRWEKPSGVEAGATVGVGGNQPYGSASMAVKHEKLDLRMAYVGMGDHFRRTGVPSPVQSEADRENVLLTLRPADGFSFGIGRQNFRQDSTLPGIADRATLNQVFGSARILGSNLAAGLFDSRTPGTRSTSSYVSALARSDAMASDRSVSPARVVACARALDHSHRASARVHHALARRSCR